VAFDIYDGNNIKSVKFIGTANHAMSSLQGNYQAGTKMDDGYFTTFVIQPMSTLDTGLDHFSDFDAG
jgi:hypothetical protein